MRSSQQEHVTRTFKTKVKGRFLEACAGDHETERKTRTCVPAHCATLKYSLLKKIKQSTDGHLLRGLKV